MQFGHDAGVAVGALGGRETIAPNGAVAGAHDAGDALGVLLRDAELAGSGSEIGRTEGALAEDAGAAVREGGGGCRWAADTFA